MKQKLSFILFLILLSCLSGYLLSKQTFLGRTGINLFYKQYRFLKTWWQGGLAVFTTLLILFIIQGVILKKASRSLNILIHGLLLLLAVAGLYFAYNNFRHDFSHRLLGERFHLGAYLFWAGCMAISIYYLAMAYRAQAITNENDTASMLSPPDKATPP